MSAPIVCPHCGTSMQPSVSFCPGCNAPRTHVRRELERRSRETGVPYDTLVERERAKHAAPAKSHGTPRWLIVMGIVLGSCVILGIIGAAIDDNEPARFAQPVATRRAATFTSVPRSTATHQPTKRPATSTRVTGGNCAPGYSPCIPPWPPDLDCGDLGGLRDIRVTGSDPHGLDRDGDGIACEG